VTKTIRTSPAFLALAGVISGAFAILISTTPQVNYIGVGLAFGLALITYFAGFEKQRSLLTLALFLCICTVAWPIANLVAFAAMVISHAVSSVDPPALSIPLPAFFVGGFAGALLVLGAGVIQFGSKQVNRRVVGMVLLCSAVGGVLGVIGAAADGIRTHWIYYDMRYLPLIWQPGAALLLGLLLRDNSNSTVAEMSVTPVAGEAIPETEKPRWVAGVLLVLLLALIGFWAFTNVQTERAGIRLQLAAKHYEAEAPPRPGDTLVEPRSLEDVLILDPIDGLHPWQALAGRSWSLGRQYSVGYSAVKDPPPATFVQRIALVEVAQMPNEQWAQYQAKNPRLNVLVVSPDSLSKVRRFDQVVLQDTYSNLCFHWPSGNFVVSVCFDTPYIHDALLNQYLEKYPSSLTLASTGKK